MKPSTFIESVFQIIIILLSYSLIGRLSLQVAQDKKTEDVRSRGWNALEGKYGGLFKGPAKAI